MVFLTVHISNQGGYWAIAVAAPELQNGIPLQQSCWIINILKTHFDRLEFHPSSVYFFALCGLACVHHPVCEALCHYVPFFFWTFNRWKHVCLSIINWSSSVLNFVMVTCGAFQPHETPQSMKKWSAQLIHAKTKAECSVCGPLRQYNRR